jgi:hypothetical protein
MKYFVKFQVDELNNHNIFFLDQVDCNVRHNSERSTNSSNLSSISDEDDIGDISRYVS